jgi:hypothetical protein
MEGTKAPRVEKISLEDDPSDLRTNSPLDSGADYLMRRKKSEKGLRLFQRTPKHNTKAADGQSTLDIENEQAFKIDPESPGHLKDDYNFASETSPQLADLELLSDLELNDITITNTKRNSKRDLKKTLSRIQHKLHRLSVHPELEAIPLIRPERVRDADCDDIDEMNGSATTTTLKEALHENRKVTEHIANGPEDSNVTSTPVISGMQSIGGTAAERGSGVCICQRLILSDSVNSGRGISTSKRPADRPSVRISTAVVIIEGLQDNLHPVLLEIDREAHPSRSGPYAMSPQRCGGNELADENDPDGKCQRRERKESDSSSQRSSDLRNKQPILATSLMR